MNGSDKDTDKDNTTKVVIWMSFSFFLAEAPIGVSYFFLSQYLEIGNGDML